MIIELLNFRNNQRTTCNTNDLRYFVRLMISFIKRHLSTLVTHPSFALSSISFSCYPHRLLDTRRCSHSSIEINLVYQRGRHQRSVMKDRDDLYLHSLPYLAEMKLQMTSMNQFTFKSRSFCSHRLVKNNYFSQQLHSASHSKSPSIYLYEEALLISRSILWIVVLTIPELNCSFQLHFSLEDFAQQSTPY